MKRTINGEAAAAASRGRFGRQMFTLPPLPLSTLPEQLLAFVPPQAWGWASLTVGSAMYALLWLLVLLSGATPDFLQNGNWWYGSLLAPVLTTTLLLLRPGVRRLFQHCLARLRHHLPPGETIAGPELEATILSPRWSWLVFGLGSVLGVLLLQPWTRPFPVPVLIALALGQAVMSGLLVWSLVHALAIARRLSDFQRQWLHLLAARPYTRLPLAHWNLGLVATLIFLGSLATLFIRREELLDPEFLISFSLLMLTMLLFFLRSGGSSVLMARYRIVRAFILFTMTLLVGTLGYHRLEQWSMMEGLYMTVITMTTIGYGETRPLSEVGRLFTIFLSLTAVGIGGYAISTGAAFIVEGDFRRLIRGNKMDKEIARLQNHVIVCGLGRVGLQVVTELHKTERPFVVIESDAGVLESLVRFEEALYVQGDATQDEVLRRAGIERAAGIVVALQDDKDNAFVILSARSLNAQLRIVARLADESNAAKLRRVGADEVVSPNVIGGLRMASLMIRPTVVTFLDEMLNASGQTLRFEEIEVVEGSELVGRTLAQTDLGRRLGLLVVAIRMATGGYQFNPGGQAKLDVGDVLIVIGTPEQISVLRYQDSI